MTGLQARDIALSALRAEFEATGLDIDALGAHMVSLALHDPAVQARIRAETPAQPEALPATLAELDARILRVVRDAIARGAL